MPTSMIDRLETKVKVWVEGNYTKKLSKFIESRPKSFNSIIFTKLPTINFYIIKRRFDFY